ncbi:MAG: class I adenylate-forming enzyme family protein [Acidimicrobiia bacterium]
MPDWVEATTVGDLLVRAAASVPETTAVVLPPDRLTYRDLLERVGHTAAGLTGLGIGRGDHVGLLMPNCVDFVEAFLALSLLGAVSVPINTRYQPGELAYLVEHARLAAVVVTDGTSFGTDFSDLVHRSGTAVPVLERAAIEGAATSVPASSVAAARRQVRIRDTALLLYTSGTTSAPKGCLLSHEAVVRTAIARITERPDQGPTVIWTPCPLFHVGALVPLVGCVGTGSTFVTTRWFSGAEALRLLESERVTTALPLFPAFTDAMIDDPAFPGTDRSSLQQILSTGSPDRVERAMTAFAPARLVSAYGMTELCGVMASSRPDESDDDRLAWDGSPFTGIELRIVDPDSGSETEPGVPGEITARGYCMLDGYYRDQKATEAAIDADGWFHTGDMGVADGQGRVAFRGRYKDVLKVGGENVAPLEVEAFLARHPEVAHVEVVGAPDARLDEVVAAFVELHPGSDVTESELVGFCRDGMARFKVPRYIRFVEPGRWPMSATKVNKVALRRQIHDDVVGAEPAR